LRRLFARLNAANNQNTLLVTLDKLRKKEPALMKVGLPAAISQWENSQQQYTTTWMQETGVVWYARAQSPISSAGLHTRRSVVLTGCHLLAETLREYSWRNSGVGWFQEEH
jgi:hypothetical protein